MAFAVIGVPDRERNRALQSSSAGKREVGEFSLDDIEELKVKVGKLTERELELLHGYEKALAGGLVNARIYIHEHSEEMQPLIDRIQEAGLKTGDDSYQE